MKIKTNLLKLLLLFVIVAPVVAFAGTSGPSPIPPPPNFQISTNTLTLCKGLINEVPISIRTPLGASLMQAVQLSLTNSRSAYTVGNGTVSAVNVSSNLTRTVNLPVFVSLNASSLISAGISINYEYDTLYTDSEVRNISFGIDTCATPLAVSVRPKVLVSGRIENVTLNLTNNGKLPLNFISIRASLPSVDGTFLGIQPVQVSSIAPGSTVFLNQSVFVYRNATQSFPVNLSISMYNGTSLEQISDNPIVLSTGIINITASSVTLSPQRPSPGGIFSISFVLTDIGTSGASAATATALSTSGFAPYGSNTVFIGDMQTDTQTPVTLTLTVDNATKSGTYTIPIKINYLDSLRENLSTTVDVPVGVGSAGSFNAVAVAYKLRHSGGIDYSLVIVVILIIIIAVLAYLLHKEKKKHHSK